MTCIPAFLSLRPAGRAHGWGRSLAVVVCAAALSACQPKPTAAVATGAVPLAQPAPVAAAPAPVAVVGAQPAYVVPPAVQPGVTATQAAPQSAVAVAQAAPQPAVVATQAAPAVAATRPVPTYSDAGPPQVQPAVPVAAPPVAHRPARVAQRAAAPVPSGRLGRVTSVEAIRERPEGSGAGGVAGAALGGLVGNHFGHGTGRAALTVLGVAGGALAGNHVERNLRERTVGYRVNVRLDNGEDRTFEEPSAEMRVGDRVRVTGSSLRRV